MPVPRAVPQFAVADVVRTAGEWRVRGAELLSGPEPEVTSYGQREVVIRDPDGRVLAFGEASPGPSA